MTEPLSELVRLDYRNWEGKRALRLVQILKITFRSTPHHPSPQYMLDSFDYIKHAYRSFALNDVLRMACVTENQYHAARAIDGLLKTTYETLCNAPWPEIRY